MAMLKTMARKGSCSAIKAYLEKGGRSMATDVSDDDYDPRNGDKQFAATRAAMLRNGGRGYYHFVISPDPRDHIDIAALRRLATEWVRSRYPEGQWAIEYHDDNGIPHAHVVLNAVLPAQRKKVHIGRRETELDTEELQRICKELGLSEMCGFDSRQDEDGVWIVRAAYDERRMAAERKRAQRERSSAQQRWMRKNGVHLWKDDVRNDIEGAIDGCRTWEGFVRSMERSGYSVREGRRGVLTFYPPEGRGRPVKGFRIDDSYSKEGIRARLAPRIGRSGRRVDIPVATRITIPGGLAERYRSSCTRSGSAFRSSGRLEAALAAIDIIEANGFTSLAQMATAADELRKRADELGERLEEVRNAHDQIDEAARRVNEISALRAKVGTCPRGRIAGRKWERENSDDLAWIGENVKWLEERGLSGDATLSDLRAEAKAIADDLAEIGTEAERVGSAAQRFSEAAAILGGLPCPAYERDESRRWGREASASRAASVPVRVYDAEQTRAAFEVRADIRSRLEAALADGTLSARLASELRRIEEERLDEIRANADRNREGMLMQQTDAERARIPQVNSTERATGIRL